MKSIEASMAGYYADRAQEYERVYEKPERQADLTELRGIVQRQFSGAHVFEVACGTGYWTEILARSAASVVATDINDSVLALARSKRIDRRRVTFRREDAYALPVLPQKFTGGFAGFWYSHIPKARVQSFLRGFHRMLGPGARVMFIDNAYVEGSSTPVSRTDLAGDTYQTRRLDDGSTHEVLKNFPTESELCSAVAGWATDVEVECLRYYWILRYVVRVGERQCGRIGMMALPGQTLRPTRPSLDVSHDP
jgi:SAM-dependent methyltransferase